MNHVIFFNNLCYHEISKIKKKFVPRWLDDTDKALKQSNQEFEQPTPLEQLLSMPLAGRTNRNKG